MKLLCFIIKWECAEQEFEDRIVAAFLPVHSTSMESATALVLIRFELRFVVTYGNCTVYFLSRSIELAFMRDVQRMHCETILSFEVGSCKQLNERCFCLFSKDGTRSFSKCRNTINIGLGCIRIFRRRCLKHWSFDALSHKSFRKFPIKR